MKNTDISDDMKQTISDFAIENGLTIVPDFWNVAFPSVLVFKDKP